MKLIKLTLLAFILSTPAYAGINNPFKKDYKCQWVEKQKCSYVVFNCEKVYNYVCVKEDGKTWESGDFDKKKLLFKPKPPKDF